MAQTVISQLAIKIAAETAEFTKGIRDVQSQFGSFTNGLTNIAAGVATAFSVDKVVDFTIEVSKLAGQAEGVRNAFEKLPDSIRVLQEMKTATGGTVSELELMKNAVQANNFQIPIQQLGRLFEFATLRAQQTGQSVDYLVQSIILGIGRKSPLILDNLGISAVRLREKLRGVSAEVATVGDVAKVVGDIAEEELGKMAGFSENAATKMQRLSASWDNLKIAIGNAANNSGALNKLLDVLTRTANLSAGDQVTKSLIALDNTLDNGRIDEFINKTAQLIANGTEFNLTAQQIQMAIGTSAENAERIVKALEEANKRAVTLKANATGSTEVDPESGLPISGGTPYKRQEILPVIETLDSLDAKVKELQTTLKNTDITDLMKLKQTDRDIEKVQRRIQEVLNLIAGVRKGPKNEMSVLQNDALSSKVAGGNVGTSLPQFSIPPIDASAYFDSLDNVVTRTNQAFDAVEKKIIDVGPMLSGAITSLASSLGRAAAGTEDFGKSMLSVIGDFAQQLGSVMIATGVGYLALESGNPAAMIAGGVILVAAGAALNAVNERRSNISSESAGGGRSGGGSFSPSFDSSGAIQNSQIVVIPDIQIKGSDMWLIFTNYEKQKGYTHG
jgi:hypothetical protein